MYLHSSWEPQGNGYLELVQHPRLSVQFNHTFGISDVGVSTVVTSRKATPSFQSTPRPVRVSNSYSAGATTLTTFILSKTESSLTEESLEAAKSRIDTPWTMANSDRRAKRSFEEWWWNTACRYCITYIERPVSGTASLGFVSSLQ
jgi:hypothetical protein